VDAGAAAGTTDADQFEAFVRKYQDMVFATAVRLVGSPQDAEDVAQTVFLQAFRSFARIGTSPAAAGWLKTVTRNTCLNHLSRYRARVRFFSEIERTDGVVSELTEKEWTAAHQAAAEGDSRDRHEQVEGALRRLPDHQRVPLVLFHFENMSYQEIAGALGISLGKVKTDIHRGREALKLLLVSDHAS
jgi:RNA polymerase sigma-70 factor (ECF subfamily)